MELTSQEIIGGIAASLSFVIPAIYISSILKGHTKPHIFTDMIWCILTFIAFLAQVTDQAGAGAWATGTTALSLLVIVILAVKYGEKDITKSDKITFAAALLAIIPWIYTKDPFWSVILVTCIDMLAYYPTFRKTWRKPFEENMTSYGLSNLKFLMSIYSLNHISVVSALYPFAIFVANGLLIVMTLWRRKVVSRAV